MRVVSEEEVRNVVGALGCGRATGAYLYFRLVESGGGRTLAELQSLVGGRSRVRAIACLTLLKEASLVVERGSVFYYVHREIEFAVGEPSREWRTIGGPKGLQVICDFVRRLLPARSAYRKLATRKYRYIIRF